MSFFQIITFIEKLARKEIKGIPLKGTYTNATMHQKVQYSTIIIESVFSGKGSHILKQYAVSSCAFVEVCMTFSGHRTLNGTPFSQKAKIL